MVIDLRQSSYFNVNKDIYLDSNFDRRKRAVYLAILFAKEIGMKEITYEKLSKMAGYNKYVVSRTIKELEQMKYLKRSRKTIDILK